MIEGAKEKKRRVSLPSEQIVINRYGTPKKNGDTRRRRSTRCIGDVTINLGNHHFRVPRSLSTFPLRITFEDLTKLDTSHGFHITGNVHPENDCSIEYIDNVIALGGDPVQLSLFLVDDIKEHEDSYYFKSLNKQIEQAKTVEHVNTSPDGIQSIKGKRNSTFYIVPNTVLKTANNKETIFTCSSRKCSTRYIHPLGFGVSYDTQYEPTETVIEIDKRMRKKVQNYMDKAQMIAVQE